MYNVNCKLLDEAKKFYSDNKLSVKVNSKLVVVYHKTSGGKYESCCHGYLKYLLMVF